jgi:hypothetical protein
MVQRGPTYIMSTKEGMPRLLGGNATHFSYLKEHITELNIHTGVYWDDALPTDIADRINASFPSILLNLIHRRITKSIAEADRCICLPAPGSCED